MRLHFCHRIWIAGSEFGNNTVKACLPPTLYQWFWLMLVMNESFLLAECKAPQSLLFLLPSLLDTNLQSQRFFFPFPSPWLSVQTWFLQLEPLSQPLQKTKQNPKTSKHVSTLSATNSEQSTLNTTVSLQFLTYHRFNPLRLCLLLHNLLCLLGDQQLGLLALPANMLKSS